MKLYVMTAHTLRIALVSETFPPEINGVANTLGRLSEGLRSRGHDVELVRPRQASDLPGTGDDQALLCRGWPLPGYPGLQWGQVSMHKLLRHWRRQRPDVLYIATEGPLGLSALRAARRLGIAVVSGFHTNFQLYTAPYGLGLLKHALTHYLRWFHNRTHTTLVPSISQRQTLQRRGFERLGLLARGVDSHLFNPARRSQTLREHWGLGNEDIALMYVGRLAVEKNLGLLRRSVEALCQAYPQRRIRLIVVGDGPQRAALEQQLPQAVSVVPNAAQPWPNTMRPGISSCSPASRKPSAMSCLKPWRQGWGSLPTMKPLRLSISATGTVAHWPCQVTRMHSSTPPVGYLKTVRPCAGYA